MRDFDTLDTNSFKAFWVASDTLNFTIAAKKAGLTQSGVSQHISKLEKQLGAPLFERVNKKVFLTSAGKTLKTYIEKYLDQAEVLKEEIGSQTKALSGLVSYAMPTSCLLSPHFSILLERRKKEFTGINLDIMLCSNDQIVEKLLNNEINFGFLTKKINVPGIKLEPFCTEKYILVGSDKNVFKNLSVKALKELPFIDHPGADILFEHWGRVHFPKNQSLTWDSLNIVGRINSLSGAIDMVVSGMGLTVIAEHCVRSQIESKILHRFGGDDCGRVTNDIYLATVDGVHIPRRVDRVINVFNCM